MPGNGNSNHTVRAGRDAISAVKLSQELTAQVDAWGAAHHATRADAIRQLIERGLASAPDAASQEAGLPDPRTIEEQAIRQLDRLLDPSLTPDERERRIRRLIDGPPEFSEQRIDLPRQKT